MCQEIIHSSFIIFVKEIILSNRKPLTSISIFIPPSWKYPVNYEVILLNFYDYKEPKKYHILIK
jgi:hypothetical protein